MRRVLQAVDLSALPVAERAVFHKQGSSRGRMVGTRSKQAFHKQGTSRSLIVDTAATGQLTVKFMILQKERKTGNIV